MKKILLLAIIAISSIGLSQMPETADSIYWSAKFCDTSETVEDCYESYTYNANIGCYQAGTYGTNMCDQLYPEIWLFDSYDCCCKVASLPGAPGVWNGFMDSDCPAYLDSIGFVFDDPEYINWTSLSEMDLELEGIYIDMYGRQYTIPPKGLSIMNKNKYYRFN